MRSDFAPIMFNREIQSGYWDHPLKEVTNDAKLVFVSFFDWDDLDYRDNRYVRVIVGEFLWAGVRLRCATTISTQ